MEFTWDGVPVAADDPRGCTIVVWRDNNGRREYLVLHRRAAGPAGFAGDWAWTPPAGSRQPGESPDTFAARELREETGLVLDLARTDVGTPSWLVYLAEAPGEVEVTLDAEHDRFEWVTAEEASARCLPSVVGRSVAAADALVGAQARFARADETPSPTKTVPDA